MGLEGVQLCDAAAVSVPDGDAGGAIDEAAARGAAGGWGAGSGAGVDDEPGAAGAG